MSKWWLRLPLIRNAYEAGRSAAADDVAAMPVHLKDGFVHVWRAQAVARRGN